MNGLQTAKLISAARPSDVNYYQGGIEKTLRLAFTEHPQWVNELKPRAIIGNLCKYYNPLEYPARTPVFNILWGAAMNDVLGYVKKLKSNQYLSFESFLESIRQDHENRREGVIMERESYKPEELHALIKEKGIKVREIVKATGISASGIFSVLRPGKNGQPKKVTPAARKLIEYLGKPGMIDSSPLLEPPAGEPVDREKRVINPVPDDCEKAIAFVLKTIRETEKQMQEYRIHIDVDITLNFLDGSRIEFKKQ